MVAPGEGKFAPPQHQRLDAVLVERGLAQTAARAQALIAAGLIEIDGRLATAASAQVPATATLRLVGRDHPWASRAGLKLDAALDTFGVSCIDQVVLDAGASTGGFVSVLLHRGARLVYAVDVGHGQLLTDLVNDSRVVVMDRTNLRTLTHVDGPPPTLITLDLSFISLRRVVAALVALAPGADVVALFKPQFELSRAEVGPGGIVRDPVRAEQAAREFLTWIGESNLGEGLSAPAAAAVRGTKGNQEWLLYFRLAEISG